VQCPDGCYSFSEHPSDDDTCHGHRGVQQALGLVTAKKCMDFSQFCTVSRTTLLRESRHDYRTRKQWQDLAGKYSVAGT
jgi:hypothetical protein